MSGMAGNVTAFNTVWTCDLYQATSLQPARPALPADGPHHHGGRHPDQRRLCGRGAQFNNIMDMPQLVFGFINTPAVRHVPVGHVLAAGDRPRRVFGLLAGTGRPRLHHRLTLPAGAAVGVKGGWLVGGRVTPHLSGRHGRRTSGPRSSPGPAASLSRSPFPWPPGEMEADDELRGLVYSLTPRIKEHGVPWYPAGLAGNRRPRRGGRAEPDLLVKSRERHNPDARRPAPLRRHGASRQRPASSSRRTEPCNSMSAFRWALMFYKPIIGVILSLRADHVVRRQKCTSSRLGYNVNFWWGLFLAAFGTAMLLLAPACAICTKRDA